MGSAYALRCTVVWSVGTLILGQRGGRGGTGKAYISVREEYQRVVGMCGGDEQYTHVWIRLDAGLSCSCRL